MGLRPIILGSVQGPAGPLAVTYNGPAAHYIGLCRGPYGPLQACSAVLNNRAAPYYLPINNGAAPHY